MRVRARGALTAVVIAVACLPVAIALAAPPANDNRADATTINRLPASVKGTTEEATRESAEPFSSCGSGGGSVWYRINANQKQTIVLNLQADGDLDVVLEVFKAQRSRLTSEGCDTTDTSGHASVDFRTEADTSYLIRVAQLTSSVPGTFTLQAAVSEPPARPPGTTLPRGGVSDALDRVLNPSDAWSRSLSTGVTYRIHLANLTDDCMSVAIFPPHTSDFDEDEPVDVMPCDGYRLFTPAAGEAGRYSFQVRAARRGSGTQRYHFDVARAGPDDTAPGIFVRNYQKMRGALHGSGIDVVDLYRFDVVKKSDLDLRLQTNGRLDLILLNDRGRRLACGCGEEGGVSIERPIRPGRYFAAVRAQGTSGARYTFTRISRTTTRTTAGFNRSVAPPGAGVHVGVHVSPGITGPATLLIERFDPLAGWQFFRQVRVSVGGGTGAYAFTPPSIGRYRAKAFFRGTRIASRSQSGYTYLQVAAPLAS